MEVGLLQRPLALPPKGRVGIGLTPGKRPVLVPPRRRHVLTGHVVHVQAIQLMRSQVVTRLEVVPSIPEANVVRATPP